MTPLQQKFLNAIDDNIDNIGYGDIAINYKGAAKASEQICIEEKIELLDELIKWISDGNADGMTPMLSIIAKQNSIKNKLQNQLNNLK